MEENILEVVPDFKLHKKQTIAVCTFLTGPLVAGYLVAENFNQLKERRKAINTWIFTICYTLILILSMVFIPFFEDIPGFIFSILNVFIVSYFVQRFQLTSINLHQEKGGQFFSVWRAVLASFVSLVIMVALILAILFIAEPSAYVE